MSEETAESAETSEAKTAENLAKEAQNEVNNQIASALDTIKSSIQQVLQTGAMDVRHTKGIKEIQNILTKQQEEAQQLFEQALNAVSETFSQFMPQAQEAEPEQQEPNKSDNKQDK